MISVPVLEASQVAEARRQANSLAQRLGFDETACGRVSIIATELATNIVKYGAPGELLVSSYERASGAGIEIIAIDKGPGLRSISDALRDGHSTGGSPGTGLGSVVRQSQLFDIASWQGQGTAVLARIAAHKTNQLSESSATADHGGVAVPLAGEQVCGDAFIVKRLPQGWIALVVDGLGHGVHAAGASAEALRLFMTTREQMPKDILAVLHAGMRHTRGAAVSVARYIPQQNILLFSGIGNVAGGIISGGEVKRTVSLAGTVGHVVRRISQFEHAFDAKSLLVIASDGIATGWSLDRYPGLTEAHPSLIAAVIYRDFKRGRDDASVLVVRGSAP